MNNYELTKKIILSIMIPIIILLSSFAMTMICLYQKDITIRFIASETCSIFINTLAYVYFNSCKSIYKLGLYDYEDELEDNDLKIALKALRVRRKDDIWLFAVIALINISAIIYAIILHKIVSIVLIAINIYLFYIMLKKFIEYVEISK